MSTSAVEHALYFGSIAVLAVQLVVPMTFGLREVLRKEPSAKPMKALRRKAKEEQQTAAPTTSSSTTGALALAPLRCASCKAPVPLEAPLCPFCTASVTAPPEYKDAIVKRAQAEVTLARAEKAWRWSRVTSSPLLLWPARVGIVVWVLAVVFACAVLGDEHNGWPGALLFLPFILSVLQIFIGFAGVSVFAEWRKSLPRLPKLAPKDIPAELGACAACQAPLAFAAARLSSTCGYCDGVTFRAAVAADEQKKAHAGARLAAASLVEAMNARDERKKELSAMLALMCVAELFYGALAVLMFVGNCLGL